MVFTPKFICIKREFDLSGKVSMPMCETFSCFVGFRYMCSTNKILENGHSSYKLVDSCSSPLYPTYVYCGINRDRESHLQISSQ